MNSENQNIEWKESWRDEYLKWIAGFANAQGGKIIIGKNDKGTIKGVLEASKLLEEIPNKVRDILGIMVDVNLRGVKNKKYLEIIVDSYPYPVSYKGQYHYRSGSTKQELKGAALDKFLLQKQGLRWDGMPIPKISIANLSKEAFSFFRKRATKSMRLPPEIIKESDRLLLEQLRLYEGSYLKRAAILLFHPHPEKLITGAFLKIGFFRTDDDLLYQDTIDGHLFEQVEKTMDLLFTKYFKAYISYEGISRIETYPFPEDAVREAVLNAIVHKDYSSGNPIQISVYDDKIIFWNAGQLPDRWTIERLKQKHPSVPYNPDIATAFFRAGFIEVWGRGTIKIMNECRKAKLSDPEFFQGDLSGFMVKFSAKSIEGTSEKTSGKASEKTSGKASEKIMELIKGNPQITISGLASLIDVSERSVERNIQKLQKEKKLKRIGAAKGGYWKRIDKNQ